MAVGDTIRFYDIGEAEPPEPVKQKPPRYILGLDLGQRADYSALCLLETHGEAENAISHCRYLKRWQLNTSYPVIAEDVRQLCMREPLMENKPTLCIDSTGVGIGVLDIFRTLTPAINADIRAIQIHGGFEVAQAGHGFNVPKRELVSAVQAALQTQRLIVSKKLSEAAVLVTELQNFRAEISETGRDTFEARSGAHDDLVLSVAMAVWYAHQRHKRLLVSGPAGR
jgi:Terminase RNaseH-like domain